MIILKVNTVCEKWPAEANSVEKRSSELGETVRPTSAYAQHPRRLFLP